MPDFGLVVVVVVVLLLLVVVVVVMVFVVVVRAVFLKPQCVARTLYVWLKCLTIGRKIGFVSREKDGFLSLSRHV
jgi:hypothetical protein